MDKKGLEQIIQTIGLGNCLPPNDSSCLKNYIEQQVLFSDEDQKPHCTKKTVVVKSWDDYWIHDENTSMLLAVKDGIVGIHKETAVRHLFLADFKEKIEKGAEKCLLQLAIPSKVAKKQGIYGSLVAMAEVAKMIRTQYPHLLVEGECFLRAHTNHARLLLDFEKFEEVIRPVQ